jgi:hypothetical protein
MFKRAAKFLLILTAITVGLFQCLIILIVGSTVFSRLTKPTVKEVTSPLETAVVLDLCSALAMPQDSRVCQPGAVVYAPDFFPAVRASFQPGQSTYEDVQSKLARYQYEYEPVVTTASGYSYFRAWYDFRGDRVFPVGFIFEKGGILEDVFATVGDD